MSEQPASLPPSAASMGTSVPTPPSPTGSTARIKRPISPEKQGFRQNWPEWARQLPQFRFPKPDPNFQLIDRDRLAEVLKDSDPAQMQRIEHDLDFMEHECLRLFRERDYEAKMQQNRYRLYQLTYIVLAAIATLIGSLQALVLNTQPRAMPWLAFAETVVALIATFLATISGREPPLPLYLSNRRRAEGLRREYFRFLMDLPPYDCLDGPRRRMALSERSADINRGIFPDERER